MFYRLPPAPVSDHVLINRASKERALHQVIKYSHRTICDRVVDQLTQTKTICDRVVDQLTQTTKFYPEISSVIFYLC